MRGISREALPLRRALRLLNACRLSLACVRARILIVVVAWLLGAATATGGCLLAVSLLGDGFGVTGSTGQQLTSGDVNRLLAAAGRESSSAPTATQSRSAHARPVTRRPRAARPTPTPTPTSAPTPAQSTTPVGTLLSSQGGTVVATCESAGAHLITWSPAQGYEVSWVDPGPAPVARVSFETNTTEVHMNISCQGGTPVASTSTGH
jgi:serine/threonine-protein kinase